jgi:hypothetical protein
MSSEVKVYGMPDGIMNVSELIDSDDFKKFVKENAPTKAGGEALSAMYKSNGLEVRTQILYEQKAGQSLIIKYLKTLDKNKEKKFRYTFLLAYEGFSKTKTSKINKNK